MRHRRPHFSARKQAESFPSKMFALSIIATRTIIEHLVYCRSIKRYRANEFNRHNLQTDVLNKFIEKIKTVQRFMSFCNFYFLVFVLIVEGFVRGKGFSKIFIYMSECVSNLKMWVGFRVSKLLTCGQYILWLPYCVCYSVNSC